MEFGQGKIDFDFKKPEFKKTFASESITEIPGFKIIKIEPQITWEKRPLPSMLPRSGLHGGIAFKRYKFKDEEKESVYKNSYNSEFYVPEVGYGAGGIVVSGSGPVLIGVGSLGFSSSVYTVWIVFLLLISASIWAITHMRFKRYKKTYYRPPYQKSVISKKWKEKIDDRDKLSVSRDISVLSESIQPSRVEQDVTKLFSMNPMMSDTPSLSNCNNSVIHSVIKSGRGSTLKVGSTASMLSYTSTLIGSGTYGVLTQRQMRLRRNELVISQERGVIFTVSETSRPNSYLKENSVEINFCQHSNYNECLEVFLLCQETILIGKMKNNHINNRTEPFVVQTWSIADGEIYEDGNEYVECTCMCTIRDEYIVVVSNEQLSLIRLPSYNCISRIQAPFSVTRIHHNALTIQATKDMNNIVISELNSQRLSIHVWNFDDLREGAAYSNMKTYSNIASSFTLVSSSQVLVALRTNGIVLWNFVEKNEDLVLERTNQEIQRLVSSPTGQLLLIQFPTKLSAFETNEWSNIFNIPVSSEQVCAMSFSSEISGSNCFAISMDLGSIQIYHSFSGQIIRTFPINIPVSFLMFDEMELSLLALSDRASHYRILKFPLE